MTDSAPTPTLAGTIEVHRTGTTIRLTIDGQPFGYAVDPDVAVFLADGMGAVRITIPTTRVQVTDTPAVAEPAAPQVDVPPGVAQTVARIAEDFRAVTFHPDDPNAAAIEQAAREHGITPKPSTGVMPRTIRGIDPNGGR